MPEERKAVLLRIPPELWDRINRIAQSELRSVNAQIEFMLREQLRARGSSPPTPPAEPKG